MDQYSSLSLDDVRAQLTPERARTFQIIYAAVGGSTLFFIAVVFFMYGLGSESPRPLSSEDTLRYPVLVLIVLAPVNWILGTWMYRALLSRRVGSSTSSDGNTVTDAFNLLRTAMLVRVALFEAAALLGLVICIIGMTDGIIFHQPLYFLCIVPACVFLILVGTTFPTHERIIGEIGGKIIGVR